MSGCVFRISLKLTFHPQIAIFSQISNLTKSGCFPGMLCGTVRRVGRYSKYMRQLNLWCGKSKTKIWTGRTTTSETRGCQGPRSKMTNRTTRRMKGPPTRIWEGPFASICCLSSGMSYPSQNRSWTHGLKFRDFGVRAACTNFMCTSLLSGSCDRTKMVQPRSHLEAVTMSCQITEWK